MSKRQSNPPPPDKTMRPPSPIPPPSKLISESNVMNDFNGKDGNGYQPLPQKHPSEENKYEVDLSSVVNIRRKLMDSGVAMTICHTGLVKLYVASTMNRESEEYVVDSLEQAYQVLNILIDLNSLESQLEKFKT